MSHDYSQVQNAFLDGMETLWMELFTDTAQMYLLDKEATKPNVYGETKEKVYKEPFTVRAMIKQKHEKGDEYVETVTDTATVKLNAKSLLDQGIEFYNIDTIKDSLLSAKFVYRGNAYLVTTVSPGTFVGDMYQFVTFDCTQLK